MHFLRWSAILASCLVSASSDLIQYDQQFYSSIPLHSNQVYFEAFGPEFATTRISRSNSIPKHISRLTLQNTDPKTNIKTTDFAITSVPSLYYKSLIMVNITSIPNIILRAKKLILPEISLDKRHSKKKLSLFVEYLGKIYYLKIRLKMAKTQDETGQTSQNFYQNYSSKSLLKKFRNIVEKSNPEKLKILKPKSKTFTKLQKIRKILNHSKSPLKFIYKKEEDYLKSKLLPTAADQDRKERESSDRDQKIEQSLKFKNNKIKETLCDCYLKSRFIDLSNYIHGANGFINIGQCYGKCHGRNYDNCDESAHTRFKRMLKHSYGFSRTPGGNNLELNCVPIEYKSIHLPMRGSDGSFQMEEFKTLRATKCGCR